jgi:2-C-methyl-D-erythritol 2,4-cyclodiphosphate synthase
MLRIGNGYDIHRLGADRPLVLGGVVFAGEPGLFGHSDADPVLHAVIDALLGAAALGDIGSYFPPGDPRFTDADSVALLRQVVHEVRAAGYAVSNLDITVIAERPRLRPRVGEMQRVIAGALGVSVGRVSVKGKTNEGVDALGRGEAIAAWATVLLQAIAP